MSEYTIAVVEDDEDIRANVCRFLQKSGFQAWGAESAEDFYVRLLRDRADLVVVDLGLPGESGMSLVERLASQRIPVVVQTALGDLEHRIAGLEAGALQYFVKPTDMNELVAGIRSQLRGTSGGNKPDRPNLARWRVDTATAQLIAPQPIGGAPDQPRTGIHGLPGRSRRRPGHQAGLAGSPGTRRRGGWFPPHRVHAHAPAAQDAGHNGHAASRTRRVRTRAGVHCVTPFPCSPLADRGTQGQSN